MLVQLLSSRGIRIVDLPLPLPPDWRVPVPIIPRFWMSAVLPSPLPYPTRHLRIYQCVSGTTYLEQEGR